MIRLLRKLASSQPSSIVTGAPVIRSAETPRYTARIVKTFPHDPNAFTQGLEFHGGGLYESTGMVGQSGIRKVTLETGKVLQQLPS